MRPTSQFSRSLQATMILTATAALTGTASADLITARFDQVSPSLSISYSVDSGSSYHSTLAGSFMWTRLGGDYAGSGADGSFATNCIEIAQHISYGATYNFTTRPADLSPVPGSGMGMGRATLLAELFGRYYVPQFSTNNDAAAFQVAIWEITHDDGLDLGDGAFRMSTQGTLMATAQGWLDALDGSGPHAELLAMTSPTAQDQIFMVPNASSIGLMVVAGLFGCANRRRRMA